jgi:hypothetical protein
VDGGIHLSLPGLDEWRWLGAGAARARAEDDRPLQGLPRVLWKGSCGVVGRGADEPADRFQGWSLLKIHGTYDGDSDWTLDLRTGRWVKIKVDRADPWAEEEDAAGDGTMSMTRSQMLFNLIGLVVAGHCVLFIGIAWYVFTRDPSPASEGVWHFVRGYGALLIVMIGGGAVANFARGRLSRWPTRFMIAGYCLSILLLPLAFWGLGALWRERRRQEEQRSSADP